MLRILTEDCDHVLLFTRADTIANGPLARKLGLSRDEVKSNLAWWSELGDLLCAHLEMDPKDLTDAATRRIYHYYLPVYYWVEKTVTAHKKSAKAAAPLVVRRSVGSHDCSFPPREHTRFLYTSLPHLLGLN